MAWRVYSRTSGLRYEQNPFRFVTPHEDIGIATVHWDRDVAPLLAKYMPADCEPTFYCSEQQVVFHKWPIQYDEMGGPNKSLTWLHYVYGSFGPMSELWRAGVRRWHPMDFRFHSTGDHQDYLHKLESYLKL